MANHRYDLWTHASSVAVQNESAAGLKVERSAYGAKISQDDGTDNTFHFAIPTGTKLDNETVNLYQAWLLFNINNAADIDQITVRQAAQDGAVLLYDSNTIANGGPINLSGIEGNDARARHHIDIDTRPLVTGPLVLSVHADFHDRGGEINFRGAGARQME